MSNLNINNIDVQRMINVLKELQWKMDFCSCLTMNTFDNIFSKKEQIKQTFGQEIWDSLDKHYELMTEFKKKHLQDTQQKKDPDKSDLDMGIDPDESGPKEITVEKQNLIGIDEFTSELTINLAKSTRNLFRLPCAKDLLSMLSPQRNDPEIQKFSGEFSEMLSTYIVKSQMTLEEEKSDIDLNTSLQKKISDMELELREKNLRLESLKREKDDYKRKCREELEEISNSIKNKKESTQENLHGLEEEINEALREEKTRHLEEVEEFKKNYEEAKNLLKEKKDTNEANEKKFTDQMTKAEDALRHTIKEYDELMREHKEYVLQKRSEELLLNKDIEELKVKYEKVKERFKLYETQSKEYKDKMEDYKFKKMMESHACEWIQAQVRGFFTRKQYKKKRIYKFLNGLKKVKPDMTVEDPRRGRGRGRGRGR